MWAGPVTQQRTMCDVRGVWLVLLLGSRIVCQEKHAGHVVCGDEDDLFSSGEEDERSAWDLFWDVVAQDSPRHCGGKYPRKLNKNIKIMKNNFGKRKEKK